MPEQPGSFADRLKALREAAGLSQYALAKRSDVSMQALSRLELGEREPRWTTVQRLATALGVSCEEFIDPNLTITGGEKVRPRGRPPKQRPEAAPAKKPRKGK